MNHLLFCFGAFIVFTPGGWQKSNVYIEKFQSSANIKDRLNNIAPSYLCDRFVKRTGVHNRCTRNCGMLEIPFFRTVTGQRSFYYRAVKIWNDLDTNLKQVSSLCTFKNKLKDDMINTFLCSTS